MRHPFGHEVVGGEIITQYHDQVGVERLGGIDHLPHALQPHIGTAGVKISDDGDAEPVRTGPVRRYRPVVGEDEVVEGLHRRIATVLGMTRPAKAGQP